MKPTLRELIAEMSALAIRQVAIGPIISAVICVFFATLTVLTHAVVSLVTGIAFGFMLITLGLNVFRLVSTQTAWGQITAAIEAVVLVPTDLKQQPVEFHQANGDVLTLWIATARASEVRDAAALEKIRIVENAAEAETWIQRSARTVLVSRMKSIVNEVAEQSLREDVQRVLNDAAARDPFGNNIPLKNALDELKIALICNQEGMTRKRPISFRAELVSALGKVHAALT